MSVSVVMPQLGESVTEGTVTRWLKKEGEHVTADEPLLEVSTDKVDTEIPSPATGVLRGIVVDEDETVAVGAQLAVIEDANADAPPPPPPAPATPAAEAPAPQQPAPQQPAPQQPAPGYAPPEQPALAANAPANGGAAAPSGNWSGGAPPAPAAPAAPTAPAAEEEPGDTYPQPTPLPSGESPYVTPLVRKLAAEHGVTLESLAGTGVGGRGRQPDVLPAARPQRRAPPAARGGGGGGGSGRCRSRARSCRARSAGRSRAGCGAGRPRGGRRGRHAARHHAADVPAAAGHRQADGGVAADFGAAHHRGGGGRHEHRPTQGAGQGPVRGP